MNRRTIHAWTLAIAAFALFVCGATLAHAEPDAALTDEDRADLAWFAELGFDDTKGLPLVQLTGPHGLDVVGFLVEPPDERIRLIGLGLARIDLAASPAGTEEAKRVVVEALRPVDVATGWLRGEGYPGSTRHRRHGDASLQTRVLVLADHLHRSDPTRHSHLVRGLLAHARTSWSDHRHPRFPAPSEDLSLRARVGADLAQVELARLVLALSWHSSPDDDIDREDHLESARELVRRFPDQPAATEAQELVETLARMLVERPDPAATSGVPALAFRLRDEWPTLERQEDGYAAYTTEAHRKLVALGRDAVPDLLPFLLDESVTEYGSIPVAGSRLSPYIPRVGDVVLEIIEEISGRRFVPADLAALPRDASPREYRLAFRTAVRPAIEAWHSGNEPDRTPEALERRVRAGGYDALLAAPLLFDADPNAYSGALLHAIEHETDKRVRHDLLTLLARHPGELGLEALRTTATDGDIRGRLDMVFHLVELGDASAKTLLSAAWHERRRGDGAPAYSRYLYIHDRESQLERIAEALLDHYGIDGLRVLVETPLDASPAARRVLVRVLPGRGTPTDDGATELIEGALEALLSDRSPLPRKGFAWRVCDEAAQTLGDASLSSSQPLWKRDLAIHELRAERGLDGVVPWAPGPERRIATSQVAARIKALATTGYGTEERHAALEQIEFGGLPWLHGLRKALAEDQCGGATVEVRELAGRLAFTVTKVIVHGEVPAALRDHVMDLEGQLLTGKTLHDAAWATLSAVGDDLGGASLDVYRAPDDRGVVITLTALDGTQGGWHTSANALVGDRVIPHAYGQNAVRRPREDGALRRLCDAALAAPPDTRAWLHLVSVFTGPN